MCIIFVHEMMCLKKLASLASIFCLELPVQLLSCITMAVSVPVTSPKIVSSEQLRQSYIYTKALIFLICYNHYTIHTGSLLISCGFDMQVNVWNMNNYQLMNSYKVGSTFTIVVNVNTFQLLHACV